MDKKYNLDEFYKGFIDTLPFGVGAAMYGIVYGVMSAKAGLSLLETIGMSLFVFAGASQMTAVQMISLGSSIFSIIITILIINLRHILMSASLSTYLSKTSIKMKAFNAFFMTDESFATAYNRFQTHKSSPFYFLGSGINIYFLWNFSGVLGFFLGNIISNQLSFIFDFTFVAAFIAMIIPMIKGFPQLITIIVSIAVALAGSHFLPGKWYIVVAGITASLAGYIVSEVLVNKTTK